MSGCWPMAYDDVGLSMAGDHVGMEARLSWAAVRGHPDVFEACRNAALDEATASRAWEQQRARAVDAFGDVCRPSLRNSFVVRS